MDYEEEQKNEIEALESIYCNELRGKRVMSSVCFERQKYSSSPVTDSEVYSHG